MPRGINAYDEGRLQGRNVANANSSNIISPGIVTEGLVLHLDAGNYNSYPIAGTTWYNLSGIGNNGTLTNGPTYSRDGGGSIVLDGTNDYIEGGQLEPQHVSLACWFKATGAPSSNDTTGGGLILSSPIRGVDYGMFYSWLNERIVFTIESLGAIQVVTANNSILQNTIYYVTCVFDGATTSIYVNGALNVQSARVVTIAYPTSGNRNVQIGRWGDSAFPRYFKGHIYSASIYTRALTPTEVEQNFNATRARFGV
jgi:hypothetical protein